MKEQIFVLKKNQKLVELNESEFISENQFQELLENYPNLISGSQIDPDNPRKWILISREFGVPDELNGSNKWSLDHLFIDQDGIPTLVEVKRSSDTRIRREVVGQMLDYASNAVTYWSLNEIQAKFEKSCEINDIAPDIKLLEILDETESIDKFWETVDTNLKAGKIRMLFIADKIPKELQRIIEFLNEQMSPAEVLGVEIKQFGTENLKTLVPRVIGRTSFAQVKKGQRTYNKWNDETFFTELKRTSGSLSVNIVKKLVEYFDNKVSELWYGKGNKLGSIVPILELNGTNHFIFTMWTDGKIEIPFQWFKKKKAFSNIEKRVELMDRLNKIKGFEIRDEKLDKRPNISIELLKDKSEFDKFTSVFDWMLDEYEK